MLRRPDGTFNRELAEFLDRKVAANTVPVDGVYSFDVVDRATSLLNRIYRCAPPDTDSGRQPGAGILELENPLSTTEIVPVIIFFHGGSFTHSSANSAIYDTFCRRLTALINGVVVSVNYRRSPEHRYPCAYEDGWEALKWVHSRSWLLSGINPKVHVYLAGDSSGGNIAHHVANKLDGKYFVRVQDRDWYWRAFLPEGEDRDHPACNIFGPRRNDLKGVKFPKSLVVVAGLDLVQDWQLAYVRGLEEAGQQVKKLFLKKATIGFYFLPNNEHFYTLMDEIKSFVTS
ncbi:hypothetical protein L1987_21848 [Smallanthus sonchifolius]|uniref:Uncharacterized protein n=1 Tax=Smallanthus sonchifolius TaxID=185202 RepID=A0ACB9IEP6_9ASTR|nr:hypothetical protein L1987_21848 [Smallanthus sonchifolius]